MHQLSPSEAELLAAESVTNLGHQSLVLELGDNRDGERITLDRLRSAIESSLHLVDGLRRRVVQRPRTAFRVGRHLSPACIPCWRGEDRARRFRN